MVRKLGGTRAILAYMLVLAFIGACFVPGVGDTKFTALGSLATMALAWYYSNKATKDKAAE